jgi:hypothetical protein
MSWATVQDRVVPRAARCVRRRVFVDSRRPCCSSRYAGRFAERNAADDRYLELGRTRIVFVDDTRAAVRAVGWRSLRSSRFQRHGARWTWRSVDGENEAAPFRLPKRDHRDRAPLQAVLRPGQLRFRQRLLRAYGRKCCITGCSVESALEAAHILPYRGHEFDHVQNGLLVRADLHRLLDIRLLGIHPKTFAIHVSPAVTEPDYLALVGKSLCLPERRRDRPSPVALKEHWRRYGIRRA